MSRLVLATDDAINEAAQILQQGELVAFPTETVYGLGADAKNDMAVAKVFAAKGRPSFNPLIVHVASIEHAARLAHFNDRSELLVDLFWPGPLTLVLPIRENSMLSKLVTAGLTTVAIRIPSEPTALKLLKCSGLAIAAPSANKSGRLSPTTPQHVAADFGNEVAMILAGGRSFIGVESTVLDLSRSDPVLLRPGSVTEEDIVSVIGPLVQRHTNASINAPGQLDSHYAPACPLRLSADDALSDEAYLAFGPDNFSGKNARMRMSLSETGDLTEAAANLFAMLHELDKPSHAGIAVAPIPAIGLGIAINDRLARAAHT